MNAIYMYTYILQINIPLNTAFCNVGEQKSIKLQVSIKALDFNFLVVFWIDYQMKAVLYKWPNHTLKWHIYKIEFNMTCLCWIETNDVYNQTIMLIFSVQATMCQQCIVLILQCGSGDYLTRQPKWYYLTLESLSSWTTAG